MEPLISRPWGSLICYVALAAIVLYPASIMPFSFIAGHEQATAGCHVWVLWWAQQGLSNIETDLIFYPYGGDVMKLYGSDVLSPLVFSWITVSPIFLYNVWVWFLLVSPLPSPSPLVWFVERGCLSLLRFQRSLQRGLSSSHGRLFV